MPIQRRLLHEKITYSEVRVREINILHELTYWPQKVKFYNFMYKRRGLIEAQWVAHHLGLKSSTLCRAADVKEWMHGSFNLCIPVYIEDSKRVLMRFPLPYRVGDRFCSQNGDEKVRCEAGTYAWLQQECPTVPIPHVYRFALSTGQRVSNSSRDMSHSTD